MALRRGRGAVKMAPLLLILVTLALSVAAAEKEGRTEEPDDGLDTQGRMMLDPRRAALLPPRDLVAHLGLTPDSIVADIGAGPGFLTLDLAAAVPRGRVIATDLRPDYLAILRRRAARASLANVDIRQARADRPGLSPSSVDVIVLCQVDHLLSDRASYFRDLGAALRPGGRLLIVNLVSSRPAVLAAARAASLRVVVQWTPSPPWFAMVLEPEKGFR